MQFDAKELRLLVQGERMMDEGTLPFVRCDGARWAMPEETIAAIGLISGQEVSHAILHELLQFNLEVIRQKLAYEEGQKLIAEVLPEGERQ
jgi:CRISPR/Cas system-associated endonuclease Cas1